MCVYESFNVVGVFLHDRIYQCWFLINSLQMPARRQRAIYI
jgi:hypothetical protein